MYHRLSEDELEKVKEISEITLTDYELNGDFISVNILISIMEDMLYEYHKISDEFETYKSFVADNYKRTPIAEQVDMSSRELF